MDRVTEKTKGTARDFLELIARATDQHEGFLGVSKNCKTVEQYVLEVGNDFHSCELTKNELQLLDRIDWKYDKKKECYRNAQMMAAKIEILKKESPSRVPGIGHMNIQYTEGFVCPGISIGLAHAWITINGKIIDSTLRWENSDERIFGLIPDDYSYYGVGMPLNICNHIFKHMAHISIIDDYECHWPLIREYGGDHDEP